MKTVEALKSVYNTFPWPSHVEICRARFDEVRAELPTTQKPFGIIGLQLFVNEEVPADEIHLMKWSRTDGKYKVDRIVRIASDPIP